MDVKLTDTQIIADFTFDRSIIARCKELGMRWSERTRNWSMPNNLQNRMLFGKQFPGSLPDEDVSPYDPARFYVPPAYLMRHQANDVLTGIKKKRWLFANDTGTGKTAIAIELIKAFGVKTLVVCPLSIIESAWFEDLAKFGPELKAVNLWKAWKQRNNKNSPAFASVINSHQICIVNYQSFKSMSDVLVQSGFQMVICDESSSLKTYNTDTTKDLTAFCETIPYVFLMSGTPAPNTKLEYFSQVKIIDPTVFGRSYFKFKNTYFYDIGFKTLEWPEKRLEFMEKIASVSSAVRKEDVLDLPERTFNIRDVYLAPDEQKAYKQMLDQLVAEIEGQQISAANAAVKILKLRQVTAGFLFDEDGQTHVFGKSKLSALVEMLDEIGDHQVLIWTTFKLEAAQIHAEMMKKKKTAAVVNSTATQGDKDAYIEQFKKGSIQYLICHPKSVGHGHTLVNCNYAVYYSLDYSHEAFYQSCDRIYRKGTTKPCSYYLLLAKGTIDGVIYRALQSKAKIELEILNYVKNSRKAKELFDVG